MIVIAPTSELTPDQITMFIHNLGIPVTIKETCYGANIEGKREDVRKILIEVRKLDPNRIFSKIGDSPSAMRGDAVLIMDQNPGSPNWKRNGRT